MDELKFYIDKVVAGETRYFKYFVDNYSRPSYTLALRLVKQRETAEDLVQESFVKLYKNLENFNYSVKFTTWLYKIVYNTCLDYLRKNNNFNNFVEIDSERFDFEDSEVDFDAEYKDEVVRKAIHQLKDNYSAIMTMYYLEDMDLNEISTITGENKNVLKVKLFRGRKMLEDILRKELEIEGAIQ